MRQKFYWDFGIRETRDVRSRKDENEDREIESLRFPIVWRRQEIQVKQPSLLRSLFDFHKRRCFLSLHSKVEKEEEVEMGTWMGFDKRFSCLVILVGFVNSIMQTASVSSRWSTSEMESLKVFVPAGN